MALAISDTHKEIESVVRSVLTKVNARAEARRLLDAAEEEMPPFWEEIVDLGWTGLHLPEAFGGSGYGFEELVLIVQELGRAIASGPFTPTAIVSMTLSLTGSDSQHHAFLPGFADGSIAAAVSLGDPIEYNNGRLDGTTAPVIGAGLADVFLIQVGHDLVLVDADAPGVTVSVSGNLDPTRRSGTINLEQVCVDANRVLIGAGATAWNVYRTLFAAEAAGGAQECVERATDYAKTRKQFGRVIGTFQAVKHHCADMLVDSELATAAVWDAARAASSGAAEQFELAAAVAAVQAIPAFLRNAQLNIQVHGGIGFTWEHDGHMLLRRAATLASLVDADAAAVDVARLRAAGTLRSLGLDLPPEADAIRETTRAVAREIAALPSDQQRGRLIDTGYVQPHWPAPWGRGAGALEQLVIDEEFATAKICRPQYGVTGWVILTVMQHSTLEQIQRWVRPTLAGELVWCQLFSEPDAGSDAAGIRTRGTRVDGGYLINGQKVWTSGAQHSHLGLATVRTDVDAPKHNGITTVVIDMKAPGVEVRPLREASGASMFNEVFFSDVFVPDDDIVGPIDGGWKVARSTLGNERVSIGGGSEITLRLDLASLLGTHGARLADAYPLVGRHLAEEQTMRVVNLRAAQRAVAGGEPGPEGNITKLLSAENMQRSADLGLRLIGPSVATLDGPGSIVAELMIFSRAMTIAGGTSEITRSQIGERILGLPRDPLI